METATDPSGQEDRRALAAVAAQFWVNGMVYAAVIPRLPDIRDRLSLDISTLGLILTVSALGGLIGSAFGGPAIIRFGTRRCIVYGTIVTLVGLVTVGAAPTTAVLILGLGLLAMFDVVVDIAMNIQGSRLSTKRATPVMNRLHGLWSLGTVIGGLIAVRAASAGVAIWIHLSGIALLLTATLAVSSRYLLKTDEPAVDQAATDATAVDAADLGDLDAGPSGTTATAAAQSGSGRLLSSPVGYAVVLGLLGGAAVTMEMTTSDWAAFRLADDLAVDAGRVGLGFVAFTSGMGTGRFAGDAVQSRLGPKALIRGAMALAIAGLVLATVLPQDVYASVSWLSPTIVTIGGYYLAALGVSVIFPQLYDSAAKAPGPAGRGLAALTAGTRVAGLAAPIIVGFLADTSLTVGTAVAFVTIPCCIVTFIVALAPSD